MTKQEMVKVKNELEKAYIVIENKDRFIVSLLVKKVPQAKVRKLLKAKFGNHFHARQWGKMVVIPK
jgi:hypothetical protein